MLLSEVDKRIINKCRIEDNTQLYGILSYKNSFTEIQIAKVYLPFLTHRHCGLWYITDTVGDWVSCEIYQADR